MVSQISKPEIIYPDSDGKPMADNTKQFELIVEIKKGLDLLYINEPNVFIAGDLFWYPVQGQSKIVTAPDVMAVFGRPKSDRGSYRQWEEDNIAPQVVFEILSPSNDRIEMSKKLLFFDRHQVEEYYLYDPETNFLDIWIRTSEGLEPIAQSDNWISPRLGVRFDTSTGRLQLYKPDGTKFYSYIEVNQLLEQTTQQLAEAQALLQQYRDRFGELPSS
ncbi:Uma2 family endonuclease [Pseudanabaena sp. UWO311]|uniref:Uma2 family endonuclease n=1 Tax=Pseudanabaena sp. UWO311 TaxID=2487337 RepID=UPI001159140C|nr:Uma2 family endonuclease [Pseudanabaena sp. UWO311]TYQ24314.1 Uma2 family endonuclease [Pseudanabaena sp. UWO311]